MNQYDHIIDFRADELMTVEEMVKGMNEKTVEELIAAHRQLKEQPLILAVRYKTDDPKDIYLLEILQNFPGGDEDELLITEFGPSAQLRILGSLYLALSSPAQLKSAVERRDSEIELVKAGVVVYDDRSKEALKLKKMLGL